MAEPSAQAPVAEALQASTEEVGVKCFAGNLAFATTAEELKSTFGSAGEIVDAEIITRGSRSLGYAFITFKNKDDATKAVSSFDKTELNGRTINVEIAKPAKSAPGGDVAGAAAEAGASRGKGRPRRGGRTGRAPKADGEADATPDEVNGITEGVAGLSTEEGATRGGRSGRGRGRGGRTSAPRGPVGPPTGEPSKSLVFVANLPFSVKDDALKGIFEGYAVKSAKVVIRKSGYAAGKSKGFGFVDFENEEDQKRAVEQFHGKEIELEGVKRELSVKIAIDADRAAKADTAKEAEAEATAPAASTEA